MKKRVVSLLLALVMLLGALPMTAFAAETAEDVLDVTDDVLDVTTDDVLDVTAEVNAPGRPEINVQITKGETANCTVYYSENGGDLQRFDQNISTTAVLPYGIVFFVAPNEGYALSSIVQSNATAGYGQARFYSIVNGATVRESSFYTSGNAATLVNNSQFTDERVQELVGTAIEKGCEAAFIYTRTTGNSDNIKATLDFYAEKLPAFTKTIVSVTRGEEVFTGAALKGLKVRVGDVITYAFNLHFHSRLNRTSVTYKDFELTDAMLGLTDEPLDGTFESDEREYDQQWTKTHVVQLQDIQNGKITNTATLKYNYSATYGEGSYTSSAQAEAEIAAYSAVMYEYRSASSGLTLPAEIAALAPVDNTSYAEGSEVTVKGHKETEVSVADGTWKLVSENWSDGTSDYAPGDTFDMPAAPVTLYAEWNFEAAPKEYGYTIEYYYDGAKDESATETGTAAYGTEISYTDKNKTGYKLEKVDPASGKLTIGADASANVMKVYYVKDSFGYTIEYYYDGTKDESATETGTAAYGTEIFYTDKNKTGYKLEKVDPASGKLTIGADASANVMKVYYVKDSFGYTIEYYYDGTKDESATETGTAAYGAEISYTDKNKTGYKLDRVDPASGKLTIGADASANVMKVYYVKDSFGYTIEYYYDGTKDESATESGTAAYGTEVSYTDKNKTGYKLDRVDPASGKLTIGTDASANVMKVYYVKDSFGYTIEYYYDGTKDESATETGTAVYGSVISSYKDKPVFGYHFLRVENCPMTITEAAENNVMKVYYVAEKDVVIEIELTKIVRQGGDVKPNATRFTFCLKAVENGKVIYRTTLAADRKAVLGKNDLTLYWTLRDTAFEELMQKECRFFIYELDEEQKGWTYDDTIYELAFRYDENADEWYTVAMDEHGRRADLEFTNKYTAKIPTTPDKLNADDHYAYVIGYPDGTIHPSGEITRAEVATIFFRLLDDDVRDKYFTRHNEFSDVQTGMWFNNAVSTMARLGIINGYPDGKFYPDAPITRAEFAAIAARFDEHKGYKKADFTDILGHWAADEISRAYDNGWVKGYQDGTFRPNQNITRAEAMALINRVLNRAPETKDDLLKDMNTWSDNMNTNAWYYLDVQEASNSHDYHRKSNGYETWLEMLRDPNWKALEY